MDEFTDPNAVKVVIDKDSYAMYFSRATIPYIRDKNSNSKFSILEKTSDEFSTENNTSFLFLKHLGIYVL